MKHGIEGFQSRAVEKLEENAKFLKFIGFDKDDADEIDDLLCDIAIDISSEIDCTHCGQCCRDHRIVINRDDQRLLANWLGITMGELTDEYLESNNGSFKKPLWLFRQVPCPFLHANKCAVYECRPEACRNYPYLDKPGHRRSIRTIMLTLTCPIVFFAIEELKERLGFSLEGYLEKY